MDNQSPAQQAPPSPAPASFVSMQEVPNQKPNWEKKFLLWFIIIILIFGIFALVIFIQQQFIMSQKVTPSPTPQPTIQATRTPTPSLLSKLNTYTSSESANKFTFTYPASWDTTGTTDIIVGPKDIIKDIKELRTGSNDIKLLFIHEMDKPYPETVFASDAAKTVSVKDIKIGNLQAKEYTETYIATPNNPYFEKGDIDKTVVFEYKDKFYSIELSLYQYLEVYNNVLTSFIFVEE